VQSKVVGKVGGANAVSNFALTPLWSEHSDDGDGMRKDQRNKNGVENAVLTRGIGRQNNAAPKPDPRIMCTPGGDTGVVLN